MSIRNRSVRPLVALVGVLSLSLTLLSISSANAATDEARDTPGCVTKHEFKSVRTMGFEGERFGHRKNTVRRIFDTAGKRIKLPRAQRFWKNTHRSYRPCDRRRGVYVVNYFRPRVGGAFRAYAKDRGCLQRGSMYPVTC